MFTTSTPSATILEPRSTAAITRLLLKSIPTRNNKIGASSTTSRFVPSLPKKKLSLPTRTFCFIERKKRFNLFKKILFIFLFFCFFSFWNKQIPSFWNKQIPYFWNKQIPSFWNKQIPSFKLVNPNKSIATATAKTSNLLVVDDVFAEFGFLPTFSVETLWFLDRFLLLAFSYYNKPYPKFLYFFGFFSFINLFFYNLVMETFFNIFFLF